MDLTETFDREEQSASALGDLYTRHSGPAFALAYMLTGSRVAAEDLVHEAFLRVTGRFAHIKNKEALGVYLRRTIVNLHVSLLRRARRESALLLRQKGVRPRYDFIPDLEQRDELVAAIRALPPRQQAAVVLRYCLDYSEAQVAETMHCSPVAARSLISRGLRTLRTQIGGANHG